MEKTEILKKCEILRSRLLAMQENIELAVLLHVSLLEGIAADRRVHKEGPPMLTEETIDESLNGIRGCLTSTREWIVEAMPVLEDLEGEFPPEECKYPNDDDSEDSSSENPG